MSVSELFDEDEWSPAPGQGESDGQAGGYTDITSHVSKDGRVPCRWSHTVTRSNPSSSACRASATGSERPEADGMTLTPKTTSIDVESRLDEVENGRS